MPDAEVVGLSDPMPEAMARVNAELGRELPQFVDYRELLDSGLDAVCIASPDSYHIPQVLDALAANLHVLCEKPLTPDPDELESVLASRDEVNKVVSMTYPRRYDAGIRRMREEILSGRWGRLRTITAYNAEDWVTPNAGTWRHDPTICPGGFFYDASGHQLDTVFWATGLSGVSVRAFTDNRGTPIPLVIWGNALLTGGVPFIFTFVGDAHNWREQINFHCEGADFAIESGRGYQVEKGRLVLLAPDDPGETADAAFVKLIQGEGPNWAAPDTLWPVLRFTQSALLSAAEARDMRLPNV